MNAHDNSQFPMILKAPGAGGPLSMSSEEIAELTEKRHDNVVRDIKNMLVGLYGQPGGKFEDLLKDPSDLRHLGKSVTWEVDARGYVTMFHLDKEHSFTLVAGYDVQLRNRVIKRWLKLEEVVARPAIPTTAEAFASVFQMVADGERVQAAQGRAIARIEEKVERVETAQIVQRVRPINSESITHIRVRIGKRYGLSAAIIDEVIRQTPYAPKPAAMVKNDHENADGSSYAVYWKKDVTEVFDRFVGECVPVTPTMFTHPFIEGRFRCSGKGGMA
ncbi:Rha family transcriptional regulator [Xanthobacter autotrophicus]|uniref:Rha family transcriptional regulator n=1 Tax=Xanthobacter autotrophicus TaxID=280 RepID=UPI003729A0E1